MLGTVAPMIADLVYTELAGEFQDLHEEVQMLREQPGKAVLDWQKLYADSNSALLEKWSSLCTGPEQKVRVPTDIGRLIVISRNSSFQSGKAGRHRLLKDGLISARAFMTNLAIELSVEPIVVSSNGITSTYPARWNLEEVTGDNQFEADRRKIIEAVQSTPAGKSCVLLVRGLDGWITDVKSIQEFGRAFKDITIYIASAVVSDWKLSIAWAPAKNGTRYNVVRMDELLRYSPGSTGPHRLGFIGLVRILRYINKEKSALRGGKIQWLTYGRSRVN